MKSNISLLLGFISILLSGYFYEKSLSFREPIFRLSEWPSLIAKKDGIGKSGLTLIDENGDRISADVWITKFAFYNSGTIPIIKSELLTSLLIRHELNTAKVLDVKIIEQSRENVVNAKIENIDVGISLDFSVLDQGDFIVGQIVHEGVKEAGFFIEGNILGVDNIAEKRAVRWGSWVSLTILGIAIVLVGILVFGILYIFVITTLAVVVINLIPERFILDSRREYLLKELKEMNLGDRYDHMPLPVFILLAGAQMVALVCIVGFFTYQKIHNEDFISHSFYENRYKYGPSHSSTFDCPAVAKIRDS